MLSNYSIVMMKRDKYNQQHLPIGDPNPRLLIIRVITIGKQYIVRYPDGYTDRINEDWLRGNGIYEPDHPTYATLAAKLSAVQEEYKRNKPFQEFLNNKLPKLDAQIAQYIEAKNQERQERQTKFSRDSAITLQDLAKIPAISEIAKLAPPEPQLTETGMYLQSMSNIHLTLTSIDTTLKAMLELWKGDASK